MDNIYIRFGTKLYRQIVGIPMGTNRDLPDKPNRNQNQFESESVEEYLDILNTDNPYFGNFYCGVTMVDISCLEPSAVGLRGSCQGKGLGLDAYEMNVCHTRCLRLPWIADLGSCCAQD